MVYKRPSDVAKNKHICCSYKCLNLLKQEIYKGSDNPNYNNKGCKNPIWKSDEKISLYGYRLIRDLNHPFRNCDDFVFEHRIVAEKFLLNRDNSVEINGKLYLSPLYEVHHIDRDRLNNSPENLMVLTKSEHMKLHHAERKNKSAS